MCKKIIDIQKTIRLKIFEYKRRSKKMNTIYAQWIEENWKTHSNEKELKPNNPMKLKSNRIP